MSMTPERADRIVRRLWERDVAAWQARWVPVFRKFAHDLILDASAAPGQLVLDVGTGTGIAAFEAAGRVRPGGFVFGIDRSRLMLALARANASAGEHRSLRFVMMDAHKLFFPDGIFDAVTSNCGFPSVGFQEAISEVFRVLRNGGVFTYNHWQFQDVPAHRIFSEILQRYRTRSPSRRLRTQRRALATLERFSNGEMNLTAQVRELRRAGFEKVQVRRRNYRLALQGVEGYLAMRLERVALKQELKELSPTGRKEFLHALKQGLQMFVHGRRFLFDWKVTFLRARRG